MERKLEMEGGGVLYLREDEERVALRCVCPEDRGGLYKVWLCGPGTAEMLLGTLEPEDGALRLNRSMRRDTLERAGCWPVERARCAMVYAIGGPPGSHRQETSSVDLWQEEPNAAAHFSDETLRSYAARSGPALFHSEAQGFLLALPYAPNRPFPLTPLFCLARMACIQGHCRAVYRFDPSGKPLPPGGRCP